MTEKEVKRLHRSDLIALLVRQAKEAETLKARVAELEGQLADRTRKYEKAGTLSEAMISVNGVMEAAQKAAEQYLEELKTTHSELEKSRAEKLSETERACARREEEADRQINAKWQEFKQKVDLYIQTHAELETLLNGQKKQWGKDT